jgi:hypothetical protein
MPGQLIDAEATAEANTADRAQGLPGHASVQHTGCVAGKRPSSVRDDRCPIAVWNEVGGCLTSVGAVVRLKFVRPTDVWHKVPGVRSPVKPTGANPSVCSCETKGIVAFGTGSARRAFRRPG